MRVVVAGLGVQGHKRRRIAGADFVTAVDPVNEGARYRTIMEVPLADYDALLACIPDEPKIDILTTASAMANTCWSRSRCGRSTKAKSRHSRRWRAAMASVWLYRLQSPFRAAFRTHARPSSPAANSVRSIHACSTAMARRGWCAIRPGAIRGGRAARSRLSSPRHPSLLVRGYRRPVPLVGVHGFENARSGSCRHPSRGNLPRIELEMTLLMWRNHFTCDILAESGSAHIQSLCKWGPSHHQAHAAPAERPSAGGELDPRARRSDLGARIHALQGFVQLRGEDRLGERRLAHRAAAVWAPRRQPREVRDEAAGRGFRRA
jgi:hypothetical protein